MLVKYVNLTPFQAPGPEQINNLLLQASQAHLGDQVLMIVTLSDLAPILATSMAVDGVALSDIKPDLGPMLSGLQAILKARMPVEATLRSALAETTTYSAACSYADLTRTLAFFGIPLDDMILPGGTTTWRWVAEVAARAASEENMLLGDLELDDLPVVLAVAAAFGLEECKTTLWSLSEKVRLPKPYITDDSQWHTLNPSNGEKFNQVLDVLKGKIFQLQQKQVFDRLALSVKAIGLNLETPCRTDFDMSYQDYLNLVAAVVVELGLTADNIDDYLSNCLMSYPSYRISAYGSTEAFKAAGAEGLNALFNEVAQVILKEGTDVDGFVVRAYGDEQELELVKEQINGMFEYRPRQVLVKHVTWEMVLDMVGCVLHFYNILIEQLNPRDVQLLAGQAGVVLADHPEGWLERWSYVTATWIDWLLNDRSGSFAPSEEGFTAWKAAGSPMPDPLEEPLGSSADDEDTECEETAADVLAENMERIEGDDFWNGCESDF